MESIVENQDSDRLSYRQGVIDTLKGVLEAFQTELANGEFENLVNLILNGEVTVKSAIQSLDIQLNHKAINSEDIIEYSDAINNIDQYILNNAINTDISNEDALYDLYTVFFDIFEKMSALFNDEVKSYLDSGGYKIGAIISLTYVSLRILYKGNFISRRITMSKTARFYGKDSASFKRLIYRFRERYEEPMEYIESSEKEHANIDDAILKIQESIH